MNTPTFKRMWRTFTGIHAGIRIIGATAVVVLAMAPALSAMPVVKTITGGPSALNSKFYGYVDGNTTTVAQFHTPMGIALDDLDPFMYVADRDNNAIRIIDLAGNQTFTFVPTNLLNRPVSVALDHLDNVYVLNRGSTNNFSTNGTLLTFDMYGELSATNAAHLTNAVAIALDTTGNIYATVGSNTVIKVSPTLLYVTNILGNVTNIHTIDGELTNVTTVVTITNIGTSLRGIVVRSDGNLAVCDSGRNGIYLIDPVTGSASSYAGFNGAGDNTTTTYQYFGIPKANAKFNQPMGIAEAGDGSLIVTDYGNHKVKVINASGVVSNLYGVTQVYWYTNTSSSTVFPGWFDGTVVIPEAKGDVESRLPYGVAFASDGTVYTTEDYYHVIRKVTSSGLPLPPPPPQVPTPQIGWVEFPATSTPVHYTSVFHAVSSFVFNNDAPIVILGEAGSQTFYTYSNTPSIGFVPDPSDLSASAPVGYQDGLFPSEVSSFAVAGIAPYVAIKAIGEKNDGSPNSAIAKATFQYVTGNPVIVGNNAAQFTVNDITFGSTLTYTVDGSDPKTSLTAKSRPLTATTNTTFNTTIFNFSSNNFVFSAYAHKPNYQDSATVTAFFSANGFIPNRITFGLTNGEPSSTFVGRPGQFYYSPVTLQIQPGGETIYSLQFNVTVTNGLTTPNKIVNGYGIDFFPMLMSLVTPKDGVYFPPSDGQWYLPILPFISSGGSNVVSSIFVNTNNNLLGIGWLYRKGFTYSVMNTNTGKLLSLFDPNAQDLITYSIAHDTLFTKSAGTAIIGAYSFQIPFNANIGDQYFIQLGSPSATRDGVGAPGADVFIQAPAASQAVTVGSPSYTVGDAAPFRWLNAGDFGDSTLNNADVMQVFQSAIELVDMPPINSDLYFAMDSSGNIGISNNATGYFQQATAYTNGTVEGSFTNLLDGNDTTINQIAFGDGQLDVSDLYITYRRSLDPSLLWFIRYWTNGQFVAVTTTNLAYNNNVPHALSAQPAANSSKSAGKSAQASSILLTAGTAIGGASQTIQLPITADVFGGYPLRILGLNLTVQPLDGSPAITQPVQFSPGTGLGQPTVNASKYAANYCAAWLDSGITGLTGHATIGTLTITLPPNATSLSAYAIHFDHASASPNGLTCFPKNTMTGLITTSARTNSSFGDGIPDSWRLRYFGSVNNYLSVSNADADGDGVNNWKEYIAGTDPNDAKSCFKTIDTRQADASQAQDCVIHWPSVSGKQYIVERSSTLFSPVWTAIATNSGTGTDMEFHDTTGGGVRFYRVSVH